MEELKKKFIDMQVTDKIASLNLIVAILLFLATAISISIGYLAYSINTAVEARNNINWKIAQATHLKEFWKDIENVESNIFIQTSVVGRDAGKFIVSSAKVFDEFGVLQSNKKPLKLNQDNLRLNAEYAELISSYAKLKSSIEEVAIKYDNSVLVYSPMVKVFGIHGWDEYLSQADALIVWKKETIQPYAKVFNLIQSVIEVGEIPKNFQGRIESRGHEMGRALTKLAPPSIDGIISMKKMNYPKRT